MASIEVRGVEALNRKLNQAAIVETLRAPMYRAVLRLQRDMAEYPTQRANSSYRRTGTLGRRWTTQVTPSATGLVGKVGNNTTYGPFVQSHQFQAWMHKGRWQTDLMVIERNRAAIIADFEHAISEALK